MVEVGKDILRTSSTPALVQRKVSKSRLLRAVSTWILNISKDEDSTTCPGNLVQCFTTITVEKFLLC